MQTETTDLPPNSEFIGHITSCQRSLYAFILSLTHHASDADDILQETNRVIWTKAESFRAGTNFSAWAFEIARLQVLAHRKRLRRTPSYLDDELLNQLSELAQKEAPAFEARQMALRHCLDRLPDEQRALVSERYRDGGSVNEIAARLLSTPGAISQSLRRIRAALLGCIERNLAAEGLQ